VAVQTNPAGRTEDMFGNGWAYRPEACAASDLVALECGVWEGVDFTNGRGALVEGEPFVVRAWDRCSVFGWADDGGEQYRARARRVLEARRSSDIAREFWDGAITAAESLPNRVLTDAGADELTTTAVTPTEALARVEGAMGPGRGMVHVTPSLLTHLISAGVIRWDGGLWLTGMGNVVVSDYGYSGNGPDTAASDTTQWMFGTGWVSVFLGAIEVTPPGPDPADAMTLTNNTIEYVVSQLAAVLWDSCVHVAAQVNVGVPEAAQIGQVPGAPTGVALTPGSQQVSVAWTAPAFVGDSAITGYIVRIYNSATGVQIGVDHPDSASPYVQTGLTPGTAVKATVSAVNADGEGPESALSAAATPTA
jgi:hypothetical protein